MDRGPIALFGAIVAVGLGPALWLGAQFGRFDVAPPSPPVPVGRTHDTTQLMGGTAGGENQTGADNAPVATARVHVRPARTTRSAKPSSSPTATTPSASPSADDSSSPSPSPSDSTDPSGNGNGNGGGGGGGGDDSTPPSPPASDGGDNGQGGGNSSGPATGGIGDGSPDAQADGRLQN
jgi:uncharacterized membrane protein YgcG